jgi:hypothetical protein
MRQDRFRIAALPGLVFRMTLALVMLGAPLAAVQAIESQPASVIGEELSRSSGAGLILVVSLQRG